MSPKCGMKKEMGEPEAELLLSRLMPAALPGQSSFHVPSLLAKLCGTFRKGRWG